MKKIIICDTTLKERMLKGESISFKEKLEFAKQLDTLNTDIIEMAPIADSKADPLLIKTIASSLKNSIISCPCGMATEETDRAYSAIAAAKKKRLLFSAPVSPIQIEYTCHKKPSQMLELIESMVKYCSSLCSDVEFAAEDATRAEKDFLFLAVSTAIKSGAKTITVCDSAGTMLPEEFRLFISDLYKNVPELKNTTLSVECSNELNMGIACAFSAIMEGAIQIKTTVSGNVFPSIKDFDHAIQIKGDTINASLNIESSKLNRAIKQMTWLEGTRRKSSSPFESGIKENDTPLMLDQNSDIGALGKKIKELGYTLTDSDLVKVHEEFCKISAKKQMGQKELEAIIATVAMQVPPTYKLISYVVNSGNIITSTSHIMLEKQGKRLEGICIGDGPIDASFLAIEQIVGRHYELDDFQIQAVTEGHEAMGDTLVKLRSNGKLYSGKGISTDIIGASIGAYINALNKIAHEENEI
ncbi:MAG: alpha-isopropylmalate synthase regulatory domain-containing protein [Lachnospiraceae bacterium]|nr:alpha-isopropylmalate synthase regulatory domain-containing protein [Lachnospiraceae bacterium]